MTNSPRANRAGVAEQRIQQMALRGVRAARRGCRGCRHTSRIGGRVAMAGGGSQLVADVALVRRVRDGRNDRCQYDVFRYPPIRWINLLETIDQFSEQRGSSPHFKYLLKI